MAENVLGILFVTSSSHDRHVFRYPPDPTDPADRLSHPIYPRATYTAQDTTVDNTAARLFPRHRGEGSKLGSRPQWSNSSARGGHGQGHSHGGSGFTGHGHGLGMGGSGPSASHRERRVAGEGSDGSARTESMVAPTAGGSIHSHATEFGTEASSSSSSSDDSDYYDALFDDNGSQAPRRYSTETATSKASRAAVVQALTDLGGRRGSLATSDSTQRGRGGGANTSEKDAIDLQYNYWIGYSLDFLGDLLTPPRAACNRKFEVCVDELVFIGHPVACGADGKWVFLSGEGSDDEDSSNHRRVPRGRRMNDRSNNGGGPVDPSLRPVVESPESQSPVRRFESLASSMHTSATSGTETPPSRPNGRKEDEAPQLNMFHLVLILDKPDPKLNEADADVFSKVYREIAFKWTAAAFALQVRENWVADQARELARLREKGMLDGVPVSDCLRQAIEDNDLARSLHELFSALHKIKGRPPNTHFSNLATTVNVHVGTIPVTIIVPPRTGTDHLKAEYSSDSDSDDEWIPYVTGPDGAIIAKQPQLRVDPWRTLLILDEDMDVRDARSAIVRERRDSRSQQAEDELVGQLIRACDIQKPLQEIAHTLRFDLEGIVIPLARELVQNERAILVDVVNVRLRTILLPTNVSQHLRSITQHSVRWSMAFPTLPPLIPFIAMISQAPQPFRDLLPPEAQADASKRDLYIRAIAWLLRNDLVLQAHVRARVIASAAVKEAAWRRLWHRRRTRWLRQRKESMTSSTSKTSKGSNRSGSLRSRTSELNAMSPTEGGVLRDVRSGSESSHATANGGAGRGKERSASFGWDATTPRAEIRETNPFEFATRVPVPVPAAQAQAQAQSQAPAASSAASTTAAATAAARARIVSADTTQGDTYDSELEMDSDMDMDGDGDGAAVESAFARFSLDVTEPADAEVPVFAASFIFNPAQAQKDEARWLRIIREHSKDPVLMSRFDLCVQYFDGVTPFEEIMSRTNLSRREIDRIAHVFREHLMISIHA